MATKPSPRCALIIVDVQGDFLPPRGSLKVPGGLLIIPTIAELIATKQYRWDIVLASQDYHPPGHISFASSHPGHKVGEDLELKDARGIEYEQHLWPDHCVQGTPGVEINADLMKKLEALGDRFKLVRKGWHKGVEAYSAFDGYVTDGTNPEDPPDRIDTQPHSEVAKFLRSKGVTKVLITGLATDYCVIHTALSAFAKGFKTAILMPATAGMDRGNTDDVFDKIRALGGTVIGALSRESGLRPPRWEDELKEWMSKEE